MNKDFINILQAIRGTSAPGEPMTDGIWYELTMADTNGNPGIYGDILAKYGLIDDAIPYLDVITALEAEIAALGPIDQEIIAVDGIKAQIQDVASEPLRQSILDAEGNAGTATTQANEAQLRAWEAEAERMTADSYATEAEDAFVKVYTSNGDGTFTATDTAEYSAYHWKQKSAIAASGSAENIGYDGAVSGLAATDVQEAIDELSSEKADSADVYTKTEMNAGQMDTRYYTEAEVDAIESGLQNQINVLPTTPINLSTTLKGSFSLVGNDVTASGAIISISNGINENGSDNSIYTLIDGVITPTNGYVDDSVNYLKTDGYSFVATADKPVWGLGNTRDVAGYNPDVFVDGKWYNCVNNGTELVTNGTFNTDTDWTKGAGWTISGGEAHKADVGMSTLTQSITTEVGVTYAARYTITAFRGVTGSKFVIDGVKQGSFNTALSAYEYEFTATSTTTNIGIYTENSSGSFDNISVFEVDILPDTEYPTQFTYLNQDGKLLGVEVADGQPVDLHLTEDAPSLVEKCIKSDVVLGGNLFGQGQSYQYVTSERSVGVTYKNTTGKPIEVCVTIVNTPSNGLMTLHGYVNNNLIRTHTTYSNQANCKISVSFIVQHNDTYKTTMTTSGGTLSLDNWSELR